MLPNNIPKLDVRETNWAIFSFHFQVVVKAKALLDHFDSMTTTPSVSNPATNEETEAMNTWHKNKGMAKYLLTLALAQAAGCCNCFHRSPPPCGLARSRPCLATAL